MKNIHTTADKTITDLEIVNQRGETVYTYRTASASRQSIETDQKEEQAEMISDQDIQNLYAELGRTGVTVQKILSRYGITSVRMIEPEDLASVLDNTIKDSTPEDDVLTKRIYYYNAETDQIEMLE